jgi:hypothetical protein
VHRYPLNSVYGGGGGRGLANDTSKNLQNDDEDS